LTVDNGCDFQYANLPQNGLPNVAFAGNVQAQTYLRDEALAVLLIDFLRTKLPKTRRKPYCDKACKVLLFSAKITGMYYRSAWHRMLGP